MLRKIISSVQIAAILVTVAWGLIILHNNNSLYFLISQASKQSPSNDGIKLKNQLLDTFKKQTSNVESTNITHKVSYLLSLDECLTSVEQSGRGQPQLMSFVSHTRSNATENESNVLVPNIVHLVSFGNDQPFAFYNYVAFKSFHKYLQPLAIFLWSDSVPSQSSKWWARTMKEVPYVYHVFTKPLMKIGGKRIKFVAHSADVLRLQLIKEFGGLYIDNDVIVLRSFDDLRVHPLTLGRTQADAVSNNVMVGERGSKLVDIWLAAYSNYHPDSWNSNSVLMAHRLAVRFPHLVHIEEKSLNHPTWKQLDELYMKNYNLTNNYSIHMYHKLTRYIPKSIEELDGYNCTVGNAMRMVLYENPDLRRKYNITVGHHLKEFIQEKF